VSVVINYNYSEKIGLVEKILVSSILDIFLKSYIELKNLFSHVFSHILDLGTRWRSVVSIMLWMLYAWESPWYD
jgi:hypothetical protein